MSTEITKEIYPDIYDERLEDKADHKSNIARKRLYLAVRHLLSEHFGIDRKGKTAPEPEDFPEYFCLVDDRGVPELSEPDIHKHVTEEKVRFTAIYGQLLLSGHDDPSFGRMERWNRLILDGNDGRAEELEAEHQNVFPSSSIYFDGLEWTPASKRPAGVTDDFGFEPHPDPEQPKRRFRVLIMPEFVTEFTAAVQKYNANNELYHQVFVGLRREGVGKRNNGHQGTTAIFTDRLAAVTERLITDGISASDPHIGLHVTNAISNSLGGGSHGGSGGADSHFSAFAINLPDLDAGTHVEIIPDNLNAIRVIYYSAQLEELKLFACVNSVVEHATTGMLPVSRGNAADRIYQWIKLSDRRINEIERRGLYGRVLGLAQGSVEEALPNREFSDLWLRFLSTVSQKYREITSTERQQVSMEQVHKAGRDLAVNLSLHGYGIAHPAAIELQNLVQEMMDLLNHPEILRAYGVRDIWQLVDRVSALYLGGASNGVRYRTMAASGERIIDWLATHAPILSSASAIGLHSLVASNEFERLAELAERWLAVTGTPDSTAEHNTDPVDLQSQPTVPMLGENISIPQSVQETLEQVGASNVVNLPSIPQV